MARRRGAIASQVPPEQRRRWLTRVELQAQQALVDERIRQALELAKQGRVRLPTREEVLARAGVTERELEANAARCAALEEGNAEWAARVAGDAARAELVQALNATAAAGEWAADKLRAHRAGLRPGRLISDAEVAVLRKAVALHDAPGRRSWTMVAFDLLEQLKGEQLSVAREISGGPDAAGDPGERLRKRVERARAAKRLPAAKPL